MSSKNKKAKLSDSGSESSASDSDNSTPPNTPPRKEVKEKSSKGKDSKRKSSSDDSPKKSKSLRVEGESEPTWELGGKKFIKVGDFKGKTYVNIREFYEKDGKVLPGKGVAMNIEQWQNLCSSIEEVNKVLRK